MINTLKKILETNTNQALKSKDLKIGDDLTFLIKVVPSMKKKFKLIPKPQDIAVTAQNSSASPLKIQG